MPTPDAEIVGGQVTQGWMRRRLRPRVSARHAEQRHGSAVPKCHGGLRVLPARTRNRHAAEWL